MRTLKLFLGSCVVYAFIACGQAGLSPLIGSQPDASSDTSDDVGAAMLDALTDPVPSVMANPNQSGSRLKANYYSGADGSKQFVSWHDSQRNEDCYFTAASDGTTRCLPSAPGSTAGAIYYSDASCMQPVVLVSNCVGAMAPTYVSAVLGPSGFPAPPAHLFQLGTATSVAAPYQRAAASVSGDGGTCSPSGAGYTCSALAVPLWSVLSANSTTYAVGTEIAPNDFVQATVQTEP